MNDAGTILLVSVLLLPAAALVALGWAGLHGQLAGAERAARLPIDETEPDGSVTQRSSNRSAGRHPVPGAVAGTSIPLSQA